MEGGGMRGGTSTWGRLVDALGAKISLVPSPSGNDDPRAPAASSRANPRAWCWRTPFWCVELEEDTGTRVPPASALQPMASQQVVNIFVQEPGGVIIYVWNFAQGRRIAHRWSELATAQGCEAAAQVLLSADVGAELQSEVGALTPLQWAAENSHTELLQLLLHADPTGRRRLCGDVTTADLAPLVARAAAEGREAVVHTLLQTVPEVMIPEAGDAEHGRTPVLCAVEGAHAGIVRALAARGADLDASDPASGASLLTIAALQGSTEVAAALVEGRALRFESEQGEDPQDGAATSLLNCTPRQRSSYLGVLGHLLQAHRERMAELRWPVKMVRQLAALLIEELAVAREHHGEPDPTAAASPFASPAASSASNTTAAVSPFASPAVSSAFNTTAAASPFASLCRLQRIQHHCSCLTSSPPLPGIQHHCSCLTFASPCLQGIQHHCSCLTLRLLAASSASNTTAAASPFASLAAPAPSTPLQLPHPRSLAVSSASNTTAAASPFASPAVSRASNTTAAASPFASPAACSAFNTTAAASPFASPAAGHAIPPYTQPPTGRVPAALTWEEVVTLVANLAALEPMSWPLDAHQQDHYFSKFSHLIAAPKLIAQLRAALRNPRHIHAAAALATVSPSGTPPNEPAFSCAERAAAGRALHALGALWLPLHWCSAAPHRGVDPTLRLSPIGEQMSSLQWILDSCAVRRIQRGWRRRSALIAVLRRMAGSRIRRAWQGCLQGAAGAAVLERRCERQLVASLELRGMLTSSQVISVQQELLPAKWRRGDLVPRLKGLCQVAVHSKRDAQAIQRRALDGAALAELMAGDEMVNTQRTMKWKTNSWKVVEYASLQLKLQMTVGLDTVKTWIREQLQDAIGRCSLGEPLITRHVLVKGDLGTGKKTAADLVARLLRLLLAADSDLPPEKLAQIIGSPPKWEGASTPMLEDLKVGDKVTLRKDFKEYGDAKDGPLKFLTDAGEVVKVHAQRSTVPPSRKKVSVKFDGKTWVYSGEALRLFWNPGAGAAARRDGEEHSGAEAELEKLGVKVVTQLNQLEGKVDREPSTIYFLKAFPGAVVEEETEGRILWEMLRADVRSTCIIAGDAAALRKYEDLGVMKARWPSRIDLPTLRMTDVAGISAQLLKRRGYRLDAGAPAGETSRPGQGVEGTSEGSEGGDDTRMHSLGGGMDPVLSTAVISEDNKTSPGASESTSYALASSGIAGGCATWTWRWECSEASDGDCMLLGISSMLTSTPLASFQSTRSSEPYVAVSLDMKCTSNGVPPLNPDVFSQQRERKSSGQKLTSLSMKLDLSQEAKVTFLVDGVEKCLPLPLGRTWCPCVWFKRCSEGQPPRCWLEDFQRGRGSLERALEETQPRSAELAVMEYVVGQCFKPADVATRNAYCAVDMLELAISKKNRRAMAEWEGGLQGEMGRRALLAMDALTPQDFGLEMLSAGELAQRRGDLEAEAAAAVGWGEKGAAETPKGFLEMARRMLLQREQEQDRHDVRVGTKEAGSASLATLSSVEVRGAKPGAAGQNWNLVVTGSLGAGKTYFTKLVHRYLRAYGANTRDHVRHIAGGTLQTERKPAEALAAVFEDAAGGCVVLDDAHLLVGEEEVGAGSVVFRALLAEAERHRGSVLVVLAGLTGGLTKLLRSDSTAATTFPHQVTLENFTAAELVRIITEKARAIGHHLEPQVPSRLTKFIEDTYGAELGEAGNGHLAERLLEGACNAATLRIFNQRTNTEGPGTPKDTALRELTVADFGLDKQLGPSQELKVQIDREVEGLIGMGTAKTWFSDLKKKVKFVERTGDRSVMKMCTNMVITGNPGTGKTTFARLLHRFLHAYGVLSKNVFVEKNGLELKSEHVGGTAPKVKDAVQSAKGGCLFLDEAYALVGESVGAQTDPFSQEAVRTLLTEVENNRTGLMVVLAGYKDKMAQFMRADPGLQRRFPLALHLDDYTPEELAEICEKVARAQFGKEFEVGLRAKLAEHIQNYHSFEIPKNNGGLAVNLTEKAVNQLVTRMQDLSEEAASWSHPPSRHSSASAPSRHSSAASASRPSRTVSSGAAPATRNTSAASSTAGDAGISTADAWEAVADSLHEPSTEGGAAPELLPRNSRSLRMDTIVQDLCGTLTPADYSIAEQPQLGDSAERGKVEAEVNSLVGMSSVKDYFADIRRTIEYVEQGGNPQILRTSLNMVLTGNPGTGKTTVARLLARYLRAFGVLPRATFVERNGLELKGQFVGQTAPTVKEAVADALGGTLFIDEAYALVAGGGDRFGMEAVRTLLTEVENNRSNLFVVLAGYKDKMASLVASDPGLARRFSQKLHLADYTPEDLARICETTAQARFTLFFEEGLLTKLAEHIKAKYSHEIAGQNGGLAVNLTEEAFRRLAKRVVSCPAGGATPGTGDGDQANSCLTAADFEISDKPTASTVHHGMQAQASPTVGSSPLTRLHRMDFTKSCCQEPQCGCSKSEYPPEAEMDGAPPPPPVTVNITAGRMVENKREGRDTPSAKNDRKARAGEDSSEGEEGGEGEAEEEDASEEELSDQAVQSRLQDMGVCPQNYAWNQLNGPSEEPCFHCKNVFNRGFQCQGQGHFVCRECVVSWGNSSE
ncbi:hypothetical protein CYMTET_32312 [Cymbomonas tetramitiformis]|uniref:AAA+ ATPase domain-containing protein n=1 Tax=Cymbomonas tetramitiformis TaxID=36881 RepID=A0AAE0KS26_9CHLO|nr:hypothetical protein CYMTET_32312 [Cymbomonas tetramitiformis]